jgi:hypothetical protein
MSNLIKREIESPNERQNRHKAMEAIKVLNDLREGFKVPPQSMEYFYTLFDEVY